MATNGMSRWEMLTKARQQRVYSRSQRVTSDGDIQDWIKKVQTVSEQVSAVDTIESLYATSEKRSSKWRAMDERVQDAAIVEAQELIAQYVKKKLNSDSDCDSESAESERGADSRRGKDVGSGSTWSVMSAKQEEDLIDEKRYGILKSFYKKDDPYDILERDEGELVDSILNDLLKKDFVSDGFVKKLTERDELTGVDPRTKMALRHAQVKENREKRRLAKEKQLREQQATKDVQLQARQTIMKEEKQRELVAKREEMELQKEMAHLRKELEEERRKKEEERLRKFKEDEELKKRAREELKKELAKEQQEVMMETRKAMERREKILTKMAEIEKRQAKDGLKLKRQYFSTWYGVVLERRIQMGKAKATADWKLLFRLFAAWKNQSSGRKADEAASRHALLIREMHRKELRSVDHHRVRLLRKVFSAWTLFVSQEQNLKVIEQTQNQTKGKMAAFLEAAADGRLWTDRSRDGPGTQGVVQKNQGASSAEAEQQSRNQRRQSVGSRTVATPEISARSDETNKRQNGPSKKIQRPTEAWQVTRKHLRALDDSEMTSRERGSNHGNAVGWQTTRPDESGRDDVITNATKVVARPKSAFVANAYEHRHQAQQKILEMQQNQLKEQKRLIEDLQYVQRQQILHQQLTQQQQQQQMLMQQGKKMSDAKGDAGEFEPKHLQTHVEKMRRELVERGMTDETARDGTERTAASGRSERDSSQSTNRTENTSATSRMSKPADNPRHLKFLEAMQERASERERVKKEREEKRRKQEEERLHQLKAEAEEKQREEEEAKRKRIREVKERKEQERLNQLRQQEDVEKMRQQMTMAEEHHQRALVKYWGFKPWRRLMEDARMGMEEATGKYNCNIQRKFFGSWRTLVQEELKEKRSKADSMYQYILTRRCLTAWKRCKNYTAVQEEKADRHFERRLLRRILIAWVDFNTGQKIREWHEERKAETFHAMSVVRITFRAWKRFPSIVKEEDAKEKRLEEMRKKIAAVIPDFQPPSTDFSRTSVE